MNKKLTRSIKPCPKYHRCLFRIGQSASVALLPLFVFIFVMLFCGPASMAQFRAAIVKVDISPADSQYLVGYGERKSTGIHDRIYHRIVALDDGKTQFYIISSDICLYSPSEYDKVTDKLQKLYGINPLNVWWTVTHTHSALEVGPPGI